jgi:hypothetical protein
MKLGVVQDACEAVQRAAWLDVRLYCSVSQPGFRGTSSGVPREIVEQINENFEIPRKIPNIPRNIAAIFVWQLAILE